MANIQTIKSFHAGAGTTFSAQCSSCHGWIWCGKEDHEGTCRCGNSYRVVFTAEADSEMVRGRVCIDCGKPRQLEPLEEGKARKFCRDVNQWQIQCRDCTDRKAK